MTSYSRLDVESAVMDRFPSVDVELVLAELDRYGVEPHERERERVQLTIIDHCKGDLSCLERLVSLAKQDYRDVLYRSEY